MDELLLLLLRHALAQKASDIHFLLVEDQLSIQYRSMDGIANVHQNIWKKDLFEYLKFTAGFDLTNPHLPQSGQFSRVLEGKEIFCRFAVIYNHNLQTGVLRILNTKADLRIDQLTSSEEAVRFMQELTHCRQGLIISSGPTNSGKTTTLHAILHEIARQSSYKVVSLEDPIEIEDDEYLQLQINESQGFTYEKGIEELLHHDPDVIFIGETRNEYTAKMVVRAALTGHLCFTTVHAKNGLETVQRFLDFGIDKFDLMNTMTAILAQRLYKTDQGKECIYEILEKPAIRHILKTWEYPLGQTTLADQIERALTQGHITDRQAQFDLVDLKR